MKAYTDIEQGKELSFILPIDTADMHYQYVLPWSSTLHSVPSIGNPSEALKWYNMGYEKTGQPPMELRDFCVPCWSLTALLEVLNMPALTQNNDDDWDVVINDPKYPDEYIEVHGPNPVDTCVEMILKLKEKDLL